MDRRPAPAGGGGGHGWLTSIEGYGASIEDTVEILAGRHPAGASDETQRIIAAYAQAMDQVAVLTDDPVFVVGPDHARSPLRSVTRSLKPGPGGFATDR